AFAALLLGGCLDASLGDLPPDAPDAASPHVSTPDAAVDPRAAPLEVLARDARGTDVLLDALPRRPRFVLKGVTPPSGREAIFLFAGGPDAALLDDLAKPP